MTVLKLSLNIFRRNVLFLDQIFVFRLNGQLQVALPIFRFFRLLIMDRI